MKISSQSLSKILKFFSLQTLIQGLDFVSSFIIIRSLAKEQYALYLISLSITMSLNTLSDMGVGSVVLSEGGKVWSEREKMSNLMYAYTYFRKRLALLFGCLVVFTSAYLFYLNKFSPILFFLSLSIMVIDFLFRLQYNGSKYVLQLVGEVINVQKLEAIVNFGKFIFILTIALAGLANGVSLLIPLAASSFALMFLARKRTLKYIDIQIKGTKDYFIKFKSKIVNQLPFNIYSFYQGQINNFILSFFGSTLLLADFNVLSKIGIFNVIFSAFIVNYVAPIIVKVHSYADFIKLYTQSLAFVLTLSIAFTALIVIFKKYFLLIIGASFETVLPFMTPMAFFVIVQLIANFAISINYASGLTDKFWLMIPTTILTQIVALLLIDVTHLYGIIFYNIIVLIPQIVISGLITHFEGQKKYIINRASLLAN